VIYLLLPVEQVMSRRISVEQQGLAADPCDPFEARNTVAGGAVRLTVHQNKIVDRVNECFHQLL
jgi:hypothetical protein